MRAERPRPWYREPWPWFLIAGPAIVVVAGFVTAWLAIGSDDGLVADDYYKRGLAINKTLGRVEASARAGLVATLAWSGSEAVVTVERLGAEPPSLRLSLRHPTRAGLDRVFELQRVGPGQYRAMLPEVPAGRWLIALESAEWALRAAGPVAAGETVILHP